MSSLDQLGDRTGVIVQDALSRPCIVCKSKPDNDCINLVDGQPLHGQHQREGD